jgi:L-arabinose transport system substrate-binding protein
MLAAVLTMTFLLGQSASAADAVKIGFLVKQPEEPWFQDEWKFASMSAEKNGFTLVKIGVPGGEQVMTAIDNLHAQGAQGFIICAPDVKLGPGIAAKAKAHNLKLMSVDDRLQDGKGEPIATIPHMGISAYNIGKQVGEAIIAESKKRGWNLSEVGALKISYEQLPTAHDRTQGAIDALKAAGFPVANVVDAPQAKTDTENAFNAANIAITKHPNFKNWVAFGLNDEAVLGAVRSAEQRGFGADKMIGVGIGGSKASTNEFAKAKPTGFFGSILISPKRHGLETSDLMYLWITKDQKPQMLTLTDGMLMTRDNVPQVRTAMGLEAKP